MHGGKREPSRARRHLPTLVQARSGSTGRCTAAGPNGPIGSATSQPPWGGSPIPARPPGDTLGGSLAQRVRPGKAWALACLHRPRDARKLVPTHDTCYVIRKFGLPFPMIRSFRCRETEALFMRRRSRRFGPIERQARRKLLMLDAAAVLDDLRSPPGNRLEALRGDRAGVYSIRINDQWRLCFVWTPRGPEEVEIVDYH